MTDQNPVHPHYRAMDRAWTRRHPKLGEAVSGSQAEEMEMDAGARWALEATKSMYGSGGNEGDWELDYHPDDPEVGSDPT